VQRRKFEELIPCASSADCVLGGSDIVLRGGIRGMVGPAGSHGTFSRNLESSDFSLGSRIS